jgi:hypothetical protein
LSAVACWLKSSSGEEFLLAGLGAMGRLDQAVGDAAHGGDHDYDGSLGGGGLHDRGGAAYAVGVADRGAAEFHDA